MCLYIMNTLGLNSYSLPKIIIYPRGEIKMVNEFFVKGFSYLK